MNLVMGIDLSSTSTGIVIGDPRDMRVNECFTIKLKGKDAGQRVVDMVDMVVAKYSPYHGEATVVIEALHSTRNAKTTRLLAGLHGALKYALASRGCTPLYVSQKTAMAHLGVKGGKPEVMKRVKALGFKPMNTDESDAIAVWLAYRHAK